MKHRLPSVVLRFLMNMQVKSCARIKWDDIFSVVFSVSNGVKQGGVLSPFLFCIYIDDLLISISETHLGCYIGNIYVGVLAYVDDIELLAPTPIRVCDSLLLTLISHLMPPNLNAFCSYRKIVFVVSSKYYHFFILVVVRWKLQGNIHIQDTYCWMTLMMLTLTGVGLSLVRSIVFSVIFVKLIALYGCVFSPHTVTVYMDVYCGILYTLI